MVHLRNGAVVEGELLKQTADRVVLDLGFTVLSVPVAEIDRVVTGDRAEPAAGDAAQTADLYRIVRNRQELTVKENVESCAEAVVQVRTSISLGSGFLIHPDGYVVTNHHVISGERDLTVTLFEKGEQELRRVQFENVRIVATNAHADIALLKIEDHDGELPTVPLGDSARLRQGQTVFSIGSPLGLDRSVAQGIVSLKNRPLGGHIYIQSTTQINPGNSGGPLFNLAGEVIGINNMKVAASGVEGLGFAIPSAVLKAFLQNRDAFAFDTRSPNAGFRYNRPPTSLTLESQE